METVSGPEAAHQTLAYFAYAFAIAGGVYGVTIWYARHFISGDLKESLSLWLLGAYESTWTHHFCAFFDTIFGARHLSWRCFCSSALASFITVVLLYILFSSILGVLGRAEGEGDFTFQQVLLFGLAVNVIPDYISLLETRWILRRFEWVTSIRGQFSILIADLVVSWFVIWLSIKVFRWLVGDPPVSTVEMFAFFSVFALFFYSTFLTSALAWLCFDSTLVLRIFSRPPFNKLEVVDKPMEQIALVVGILIFIAAAVAAPFLQVVQSVDGTNRVTRLDEWLCKNFADDACAHLARLTEDDKEALRYLADACQGGRTEQCISTAFRYYNGDKIKAASLWKKACDGGYALGCNNLGAMYVKGEGVPVDNTIAVSLFEQICQEGYAPGCFNLGNMYNSGKGVAEDDLEAVALYERSCNNSYARGCTNLGAKYESGEGVAKNDANAVSFYEQGCSGGDPTGCNNLGNMFHDGEGVAEDDFEAVSLYEKSCNDGYALGCFNLASACPESKS